MDVKLCDASEVDQNNVIKLDAPTEINIPNIKELTFHIVKILEYMNRDDMKSLKIANKDEYEKRIENTFPVFTDKFYSIYKILLSGSDIGTLLEMLRQLDKVKDNKIEFQAARNKISTIVNKKYIDPLHLENIPKKKRKKGKEI